MFACEPRSGIYNRVGLVLATALVAISGLRPITTGHTTLWAQDATRPSPPGRTASVESDTEKARPKAHTFPGATWVSRSPADVDLDAEKLQAARDYALTGQGSGYITRHGYLVAQWGSPTQLYDLKSTTKSFGATALGVAILDRKLSLDDRVVERHPSFAVPPASNRETGWIKDIRIWHLATHTAGFEKPGGYRPLLFAPGSHWFYSDGGPNWLAECVTLAYRRDVSELMFERVFEPIGIRTRDLRWRKNQYRERKLDGIERREFGSGVHANVNAMARLGYLYLRGGQWDGRRLLPARFIQQASTAYPALRGLPEYGDDSHGNASDHYGLLWWNNADGTLPDVPTDTYWTWGLYDSLIVVIPSLDIVVARAGRSWKRKPDENHYDVLKPFLTPIAQSATGTQTAGKASAQPTAGDTLIERIEWAPESTILRMASGSDNWPLTWADDGRLYSCYGDGRGFKPFVDRKLSAGLVRIKGHPPQIAGENLRSPGFDSLGDGANGRKASGILMVDGVLYVLMRNADNAQLGWSQDRGRTWEWADWRFETSFGCPTFLNYGPNYAGAIDEYVYIFSPDGPTAYERVDRMVLARVAKDRLQDRDAYAYFVRIDRSGPVWSRDVADRGAVMSRPGDCYRSGVTYNAGIKRFIWSQTGRGKSPRFEGGLRILEAVRPWGPWKVVYETSRWDVGPGETSSFPTKWMSQDGTRMHLVFSGDDHFSVRQAQLVLRETAPQSD